MEPGTSVVLYQAPKIKNNIHKLLTDLIPYLVSIEVNIETLELYVKTLIPLSWKLKRDDKVLIEKISQTQNANLILLKPTTERVTIDLILLYLKDIITQNIKREELDKKLEEKRIKEQLALEQKLEKIKNKSLKLKPEDEFVEFENTTPLIINNEPINEEEEFTGIDTNEFLKSLKNKGFIEQPQFIQIEPSNDGLSDEEYYGIRATDIKSVDDSYFKQTSKPGNAEFSKFGIGFDLERETE